MTNKGPNLVTRTAILSRIAFLEVIKRGRSNKEFLTKLKHYRLFRRPRWNDYLEEERDWKNVEGDHECPKLTAKGHRRLRRLRQEARERGFLP